MNLLERYLQAVRFFLPRQHQDDIVRELSENLISQMDEREEALGRPLTDEDRVEILRRHGHPMLVAGRYQSRQQLIGPVFFPIYLFALKAGLGVALLVTLLVAGVTTIVEGDPIRQALEAMLAFPGRALMVFAWTTVSFAALDIAQSRLKLRHEWDPRTLPRFAAREDRMSRARTVCELLLAAASTVWLLLVPHLPFLLLGKADRFLEPGPIWRSFYAPMVVLALATTALAFVNVVRPYWTSRRSVIRMAIHAATFLLCGVLLRAGSWVVAREGAILPDGLRLEQVVDVANTGCAIGLAAACIFSVVELSREAYRWHSRRKDPSSSDSATARA